ncbi:MAG: EAL domain-containing protein [Oceanospirillaceae bacterium]|nr:EAL domain-containing protein [Oceanospirillaceae bacterium]
MFSKNLNVPDIIKQKTNRGRPSSDQPDNFQLKFILGLLRNIQTMISENQPLEHIFTYLCTSISEKVPDINVMIMQSNAQGQLNTHCNHDISHIINKDANINNTGSFGLCVKYNQPIFVADTQSHQDWLQQKDLALEFSIRSCCSYPFFGKNNNSIGAISLWSEKTGYPSPFLGQLLETSAHILGVAITTYNNQHHLKKLSTQLKNLTQSLPLAIVQIEFSNDEPPKIVYHSNGLLKIFDVIEVNKLSFSEFWRKIDSHTRHRLSKKLMSSSYNNAIYHQEFCIISNTGVKKWIYLSGVVQTNLDTSLKSINCMLLDITDEPFDRQAIELSMIAYQNISDGIFVTDKFHTIIHSNDAFSKMSGYQSIELIDKCAQMACAWKNTHTEKILNDEQSWAGEISSPRKNGSLYSQRVTITAVIAETACISHYVYVVEDISLLRESEDRLIYMRQHDSLTLLPNRLLFKSLLDVQIKNTKKNKLLAVFIIGLDRFQYINESLGHLAGDQLLIQAAKRLSKVLSNKGTIARMDGDEFAMTITNLNNVKQVTSIAEIIIRLMEKPYLINQSQIYCTSSMGIAVSPDHSSCSKTLIKKADIALHDCKNLRRNNYYIYQKSRAQLANSSLKFNNALRNALKNNEFKVFYQPQVHPKTGKILGAEALIRWEHMPGKLISPGYFLPMLEEFGLMTKVGNWVLAQACQKLAKWREQFAIDFKIAVNFSGIELSQDNLITTITEILDQYHLPAHLLEIEILETVIIEPADDTVDILGQLKELGVSLALDDFGSGHSSLHYLSMLPIQKLKIDKSLIKNISSQKIRNTIIGAIIALGKNLEMSICVEGVEEEQQRKLLIKEGCDQIQGYLIAKPMESAHFELWLNKNISGK